MKNLAVPSLCVGCVLSAATVQAIDLKQSKVTQVVNQVQIISGDQKEKPAVVNDIFAMPDVLRTGPASRAELVAPDETVTRVGADTLFSFDPGNRAIDLKEGSLLFHSPHGKGGGTIHTGSATASVLGTTLIVVTTPNGGLKVIALEGEVEVRFLNGLKQKLDPGQMTFILPGANQLAPVIIFRLDELTQNSLLVKGFTEPLQSLPLIQNQIDRQLKLISSGRLGDTGLYAGENATADQVEVLDLNTISGVQHHGPAQPPQPPSPPLPPPPPPPAPNLSDAEAADATINQPSLSDVSIPTPPVHLFPHQFFPLDGNAYFGGQSFSGFVARNIYINTLGTPVEELQPVGHSLEPSGPLVVDLSPYSHLAAFDLVALNDISIQGSVLFDGLGAGENFALIAGNEFDLTPGISIEADAKDFLMSSPAAINFDDISLYNADLDIDLRSASDISFLDNATVDAAGRLIINAGGNLSVTDSELSGGSVLLSSFAGTISFDNATLDAGSHAILLAPAGINLNNSVLNADFVTLSATTSGGATLNNTTINAPSAIIASSIYDLNVTGTFAEETVRAPHNAHSPHVLAGGNSALITDPGAGSVTLASAFGSVNVTGTAISAHYLTLNSGDGILLDPQGQPFTAAGPGATAKFTAPNLITVNNTDFSQFATVNMAANTIVLYNVAFGSGSQVNLSSLNGVLAPKPNTGAGAVPGDVNFIWNVTYGGDPAQNHIGSGININKL